MAISLLAQTATMMRAVLCLATMMRALLCLMLPTALSLQLHAPMARGSNAAAIDAAVDSARAALRPTFESIDDATERSLGRVLDAFRKREIGREHFAGVDGYGYGDLGREALDDVFADLMGAEAALVRSQCFSGTHAISCALFGVLRPGDELLAVSGAPYDTLEEVIGLRGRTPDMLRGTLADFGVTYRQVELQVAGGGGAGADEAGGSAAAAAATFDLPAIAAAISDATRMLHVQRSCGYAWRPSIAVGEIGRLAAWLEAHHPQVVLLIAS